MSKTAIKPIAHWYVPSGAGVLSSRRFVPACGVGPVLIGTESELRRRPQDPDAVRCPRCAERAS